MPAEGPGAHDLVVVGASAGGVETLRRVIAGRPADPECLTEGEDVAMSCPDETATG